MAPSYRDLIAWQKAIELVVEVYSASAKFPRHELYGLSAQLRRAVVSVASNIAEGQGRYSRPDFVRFLVQARGSLMEVETQLIIASRLSYFNDSACQPFLERCEEVGRILNGLISSIKKEVEAD